MGSEPNIRELVGDRLRARMGRGRGGRARIMRLDPLIFDLG